MHDVCIGCYCVVGVVLLVLVEFVTSGRRYAVLDYCISLVGRQESQGHPGQGYTL